MRDLEHEELLQERKAVSGLEFVEELPPPGQTRLPVHRYRFPDQEVTLEPPLNSKAGFIRQRRTIERSVLRPFQYEHGMGVGIREPRPFRPCPLLNGVFSIVFPFRHSGVAPIPAARRVLLV